jgi:hypothetical protein
MLSRCGQSVRAAIVIIPIRAESFYLARWSWQTMSATPTAPQPGKPMPRAQALPVNQAAPAQAQAQPAGEEPAEDEGGPSAQKFILFNAVPSWMVSAVVHFIALVILALITVAPPAVSTVMQIAAPPPEALEEIEELQEEKIEMKLDPTVSDERSDVVAQLTAEVVETTDTPSVAMDVDAAPVSVELSDFGEETAPKNDLMATIGSFTGTGVSGRGEAMRGQMVARVGGNEASEAAVARALEWFANHQNPDGSWSYDHRTGPCQGRCSDPGRLADCKTGATGMALLPFLGAGQTHKTGKYKRNVEMGLYFLTSQMKVSNRGGMQAGDLAQGGGSMYSHGIASIVLCEAYAMTHDKGLMAPAQLGINHIVYAQDPVGGGWRYSPRQAGDTSVVGWQLMSLKSGHMAYLIVPKETIIGASKFLDSVQAESGSKYGYTGPGGGSATTAVGLLCRMYLGWKRDHPGIERGAEYLSKLGPSKGNMYFNYYATQVMRQYGGEQDGAAGEMWDKWNVTMRDSLVNTQDKNGHQTGSWLMKGDHGSDAGGRIYCTSMATMILEVYYRHMPIYGKQAVEEEFPL